MRVRLRLDPSIADRVRLAVVDADGVTVRRESPDVWEEIDRVAAAYRARFAGRLPGDIPDLQPARELYRRTGEDPTKLRPSSEALLRRILRGDSLYRINSLVDTCNLCSLEFLLPIGLYDADRIQGEIVTRLGHAGEAYASLGKGIYAVQDRLALFDDQGPFGSPTNDSKRTGITQSTARCLMIIFAPASYPAERLSDDAARTEERLRQFASASTVRKEILP